MSDDDIVEVLRSYDDGRMSTHSPDCWKYHQRCALLVAADEIDRLQAQRDADGDILMAAWGLLANVSEGNWERQTDEWQDAVKRWRTRYHARLDTVVGGES